MTTTEDLEAIFGAGSVGVTASERAASSSAVFVRSQFQIARDNPNAGGRRLNASEALRDHGLDALLEVATEGRSPIPFRHDEPAMTLHRRRIELEVEVEAIAKATRLEADIIQGAETVGNRSQIRDLEIIARALGLDEVAIGRVEGAYGDRQLGVRLRKMHKGGESVRFSPTVVLGLSEASWIISQQIKLSNLLGEKFPARNLFVPSNDYRYMAFDRGRELAEHTRRLLSLSDHDPINSLKNLAQRILGIPVIQMELPTAFAGATLANGLSRGIVVNEAGYNENVLVRRMTVAHELGHLLWDPDARLNRLAVDTYEAVETRTFGSDAVEIRANAFAVNLLAPPAGVRSIMSRAESPIMGLSEVMNVYRISATAAHWHIKNVTNQEVRLAGVRPPSPSDEAIADENSNLDYFRPEQVPLSRRGRFAYLTARAQASNLISLDTAASFLRTTISDLEPYLASIRDSEAEV